MGSLSQDFKSLKTGVRHSGLNLQTQHWEAGAGAWLQDQPGLHSKIGSPIKTCSPVYTETLATYLFERNKTGTQALRTTWEFAVGKGKGRSQSLSRTDCLNKMRTTVHSIKRMVKKYFMMRKNIFKLMPHIYNSYTLETRCVTDSPRTSSATQ